MGYEKSTAIQWTDLILVTMAGAVLFFGSLGHWFFADDFAWLDMAQRAQHEPWLVVSHTLFNYWRPVVNTSFAMEHLLFGLDPAAHHATNVLIHLLNSGLVYLLMRKLFLSRMASLLATLLFAISPAGNEAVIWVSGRTDLLATTFFLCALLACRDCQKFSAPAFIFLALALLSKEATLVWPLVAFMLIVLRCEADHRKIDFRKTGLFFLPYLALTIAAFVFHGIGTGKLEGIFPDKSLNVTIGHWFINMIGGSSFTIIPWTKIYMLDTRGLIVMCFMISIAGFLYYKGHKLPLFALSVTMILMGPAALIPYDFLPVPWLTFKRFFYLPAIGAAIFWGSIINIVTSGEKKKSWIYIAVSIVLLIYSSIWTVRIERRWAQLTSQQEQIMVNLQDQLSAIPLETPVTILLNDNTVWKEQIILFSGREVSVITNPEGYNVKPGETMFLFQNGNFLKL